VFLFALAVSNAPQNISNIIYSPRLPTRLVWFAGFENSSYVEFNDTSVQDQPSWLQLFFSNQIVHSGRESSGYKYVGSPQGFDLRGYQTEVLSPRLQTFYVVFWVYVPSSVNGHRVQITSDWISFASLWLNQGGSDTGGQVLAINSDSSHTIHVNVHMINKILFPANPIKWPFDRWFSIGVYGELHLGTTNSKLVFYQNGQQIISWTGDLGIVSDGLGQMHFGLYAANTQGTIAVYNDDIQVYAP